MKKNADIEFKLESIEESEEPEDKILQKATSILKTQPENVVKTIQRFLREIKGKKQERKISD